MSLAEKFAVAGIVFVLCCMYFYLYGLLQNVEDRVDEHGHSWFKNWLEMGELKRRVDDLERNMDTEPDTKSVLYDVYTTIDGKPYAVVPRALDGAPTLEWLEVVADRSDEDIANYIRGLVKAKGGAR